MLIHLFAMGLGETAFKARHLLNAAIHSFCDAELRVSLMCEPQCLRPYIFSHNNLICKTREVFLTTDDRKYKTRES